jgi:DNA-binding CsgD family transcriptional regulator
VRERDREQLLELFALAPFDSYLERGALAAARLAGGSGAICRRHGREVEVGVPAPHRLVVEVAGGQLEVQSDEPLDGEGERAARFGAELLGVGLGWIEQLVDAQGVLERQLAASGLGPRERELCRHLAEGTSTAAIAARMGLAESSVRTYLKRIFLKMGVSSRVELVARLRGSRTAAA